MDTGLILLRSAAAWVKITVFLLAWIIIWLPIAIPLARRLQWHPPQPLQEKQKLSLLASLYLLAPLIVWGIGQIEEQSWADYGLIWQPQFFFSLVWGLALGIAGLILIFILEWQLGWIEWHPEKLVGFWSISFPLLGLGLWVGITEELIFRGVFFNQLQQDYGIAIAAIISSSIFALLHLIWEQKETLPQLPGLWLMGIVLVIARLVDDGSLAIAWGLHSAWIWGLASITTTSLISYTNKISSLITGLGGQMIAGLAGILCLLSTGVALWLISL